jgi:hypothetical protein
MHKKLFLLYIIRFCIKKKEKKNGDCKTLINCYEKWITLTKGSTIVHGSKVFGSYNSPIKFHKLIMLKLDLTNFFLQRNGKGFKLANFMHSFYWIDLQFNKFK